MYVIVSDGGPVTRVLGEQLGRAELPVRWCGPGVPDGAEPVTDPSAAADADGVCIATDDPAVAAAWSAAAPASARVVVQSAMGAHGAASPVAAAAHAVERAAGDRATVVRLAPLLEALLVSGARPDAVVPVIAAEDAGRLAAAALIDEDTPRCQELCGDDDLSPDHVLDVPVTPFDVDAAALRAHLHAIGRGEVAWERPDRVERAWRTVAEALEELRG